VVYSLRTPQKTKGALESPVLTSGSGSLPPRSSDL
jgi:hypothetical protein